MQINPRLEQLNDAVNVYSTVLKLLYTILINVLLFMAIDALIKSLTDGKDGFLYLSRTVTVLLQTLLQDEIAEVKLISIYSILGQK